MLVPRLLRKLMGLEVGSEMCYDRGPLCPLTQEEQGPQRSSPIQPRDWGHSAPSRSLRRSLPVSSTLAVTNAQGYSAPLESNYYPTFLSPSDGEGVKEGLSQREGRRCTGTNKWWLLPRPLFPAFAAHF